MSKIRSAWEIALEKTQAIEVDEEKIEFEEDVKKARATAGAYVNNERDDFDEVKQSLKAIKREQAMREGVKKIVMQNLTLPSEEVLTDKYERVQSLALLIAKDTEAVSSLTDQLIQFLKQYPLHAQQLIDQLKAQYAPMLQQKAEQLKTQYGQEVNLRPEDDKDFVKLAQTQLERLQSQYTKSLEGAKEELEAYL